MSLILRFLRGLDCDYWCGITLKIHNDTFEESVQLVNLVMTNDVIGPFPIFQSIKNSGKRLGKRKKQLPMGL